MVVVKPPSYQQSPVVVRKSGTTSLGRAFLYLAFAIFLLAAPLHYVSQRKSGLRGATPSTAEVKTVETPKTEVKTAEPPVKTIETPKTEVKSAEPPSAPAKLIPQGKVCERNIGLNLSDQTKWPTPYTPSYFDKEPESDEAVVVYNDGPYGNTLIVTLFHALDMAYDKKCGVMVTKDSAWIWDHMSTWFYGGKARDDAFYKSMEDAFGFKVVESLTEASKQKKVLHKLNAQAGLYARSQTLKVEQFRNRRDTIYRKLFSLPNPPCGGIDAAGMNKPDAKYTVIDVAFQDAWNAKFDENEGRSHTDAYEMKPDFVKNILNSVQMGDSPVFLGKTQNSQDANRAQVKGLVDDPAIKTQDKDISNDLYMAVLADVFIGVPSSHWSMMVARMRYALGMKNTFVLTTRNISYVDDASYLLIHDPKRMGLWFG
jgi:hypothetical protein